MSSSAAPGPSRLSRALAAAPGAVAGTVVGAASHLAARVRRDKPLHPTGQVGTARLEVTSPVPHLGVPLLATTGVHDCIVRSSRSAGLPAPLPDLEGLAMRVLDAGHGSPADLLFAGSGKGRVTRYLPLPRGPGSHGRMSTLLPVVGATGALMVLVEPVDDEDPPRRWRLSVAGTGSAWRAVAVLTVAWGSDEGIRFDPVLHQLRGTGQYPLVRALREPAYARARAGASAGPS